jgi:hypothetical protein
LMIDFHRMGWRGLCTLWENRIGPRIHSIPHLELHNSV